MRIRILATRSDGITFALAVIAAMAAVASLLGSDGSAPDDAVTPVEDGKYKVGVVMKGVCEWATTKDGATYPVVGTYFQRLSQGSWGNANELPRQGKQYERKPCTQRLSSPGEWRMRVFKPDGDITIKTVCCFHVWPDWSKRPECTENAATKVVAVSTPGGGPTKLSALKGTHMYKEEEVTADQDVQLTFGDGSSIRMAKGSIYRVMDCQNDKELGRENFSQNIFVKFGPVWVRDPNREAPKNLTTTQIMAGIRATTYWVSYNQDVSTVAVEKGEVWVQRLSGNTPAGPKLIVKAGQTATVRGSGELVVKQTDNSAPYPFSSWPP